MDMTLSLSSRGLVYFPEVLQKALKLVSPGKFTVSILDDSKIHVKPVKDIFSMIGKLKAPDGVEFDIEKFRKDREQNYERL